MLAQSYNLLAICAGGKLYLACTKTIFSIIFLSNVRTNSLFHTVGYKNHSVGYIFHTVKYKSRTVKQRICKEISKNTCPELLLIPPTNQINSESASY